MPCEEYERLKSGYKSEMRQYAQFTYSENRQLLGTSDRKSKQIAKAAMERAALKSKEMMWHRATCEACQKEA
jgi:hypothetical protein